MRKCSQFEWLLWQILKSKKIVHFLLLSLYSTHEQIGMKERNCIANPNHSACVNRRDLVQTKRSLVSKTNCAPEAEAILEPVARKAHTNAMYADNERCAEKGIFKQWQMYTKERHVLADPMISFIKVGQEWYSKILVLNHAKMNTRILSVVQHLAWKPQTHDKIVHLRWYLHQG